MTKILGIGETFGRSALTRSVSGFILKEVIFNNEEIPVHTHEDTHISFIIHGRYRQGLNGEIWNVEPTNLIFSPSGERHQSETPIRSRELVLWLDRNIFPKLSETVPVLNDRRVFTDGAAVKTALRLFYEFYRRDKMSDLAIEALIFELLIDAERGESASSFNTPPVWLIRVREFVRANYLQDLTVGQLAQSAEVHPAHLSRCFRRYFKLTVGEYLRGLRINEACIQLASSQRTLSEIAVDLGFFDQAHFTRAFKVQTGVTPGVFRKHTSSC